MTDSRRTPESEERLDEANALLNKILAYKDDGPFMPEEMNLIVDALESFVHSEKGEDWQARALAAEAKLADAQMEIKSLQGFADLWYFAMDHAPGDFERIVTTCSPTHWMHEIAKIKRGEA